jgi:phosphatidate phosphatase PAH1
MSNGVSENGLLNDLDCIADNMDARLPIQDLLNRYKQAYLQDFVAQDCQDRTFLAEMKRSAVNAQSTDEVNNYAGLICVPECLFGKDDNGAIKIQLVNSAFAQEYNKMPKCCDNVVCAISRQCQDNVRHRLLGSIESIKANIKRAQKTHYIMEVLDECIDVTN